MSLICCRSCFRKPLSKSFADDSGTNLKDLVLKPEKIVDSLETKIHDWEDALYEFRSLANELLQLKGKEFKEIIDMVSEDPEKYLNTEFGNLARLRIKVVACEKDLPQVPESSRKSSRLSKGSVSSRSESTWVDSPTMKAGLDNIMGKLSHIWSKRLNNINPTQGALKFRLSTESKILEQVELKPKWPDFLPDVSFDVIKVNKYGHQMRRTLKFTPYHIFSIKSGEAVTKFYKYSDIKRVWLQNETTIKVVQRNEKRNMYVSPIAPHILQQITTRVQVRLTLDQTEYSEAVEGYSAEVTAEIIKSISEENIYATEQMLQNFASDLKVRALSTNISGDKLKLEVGTDNDDSTDKEVGPASNATEQVSDTDAKSSSVLKFSNFRDGTPEAVVQNTVQKIIFDQETAEGNTRKTFVQGILSEEKLEDIDKVLVKIRHFIDGMHEYILSERAFSLAMVYQQEVQRKLIGSSASQVSLPNERIKEGSTTFLRRGSLNFLKNNNIGPSTVEDSLLIILSYIIFVVIEEAIFLSLQSKLVSALRAEKNYDDEVHFSLKTELFCSRTQEEWGVPYDLISPLNWQSAVFELSGLEHNLNPSYQLQVLTRSVKAIYSEFKYAILPKLSLEGKDQVYIAADDLVPIFIFVLCQSKLKHPLQNRDMMWALCHPDQLHGEGGYYLTVYESAIEFILNEPIGQNTSEIESLEINPMHDQKSPQTRFFSGYASQHRDKKQERSNSTALLQAIVQMPGILAFNDPSKFTMRASFQ